MWAQILAAAIGIWLMAAPAVLGYSNPAATNDHIAGPIAATFAVIACWEATRLLRWVNLAVGCWLVLAPWILGYGPSIPIVNDMLAGLLLAATAFVKGRIEGRYGGGWSVLWKPQKSGHPSDAS